MIITVLKAIATGLIAAAPVGPVLFFISQKTMTCGRKAGLISGIGSCLVDTLYAAIGLFALGLIRDFISSHEALIMMIGGLVVAVIGAGMWKGSAKSGSPKGSNAFYPVQTALCALSNPAAIVVMMAILAAFKLDAATLDIPIWLMLVAVAAGEMLWWTIISGLLSRFANFTEATIVKLSKIAGAIVVVLGIVLSVRGLIMFI